MAHMGKIESFLDKATLNDVKSMLNSFNVTVCGKKAVQKLKLMEVLSSLSSDVLANFMATHNINTDDVSDDDDNADELNVAADRELSTLRSILEKKLAIAALKKQISEIDCEAEARDVQPEVSTFCNFRDVEESLQLFSGDDNLSISKWIQQFEDSATVFGWNDKYKYIYAQRLLKGTAKLFLRTVTYKSWLDLKRLLKNEFSTIATHAEIHDKLRNRRKRYNESFQQYVLAMQEIASLADIDEADIVNYVIAGIPQSNSNKMILYNADNINELKVLLRKFEKIVQSNAVKPAVIIQQNNAVHQPKNPFRVQPTLSNDRSNNESNGKSFKCFNCYEEGHFSSNCPKPKRERGSCFKCGKFGHSKENCNINVVKTSDQQETSTENIICSKSPVQNDFEYELNCKFYDDQQIHNITLQTLLDSGSPISFVQQHCVPDDLVTDCADNMNEKFYGLNNSPLVVKGLVSCSVLFQNKFIIMHLYVVNDFSMYHNLILGRDFMTKCNLKLMSGNSEKCEHTSGIGYHDNSVLNDDINEIMNIDIGCDQQNLDISDKLSHATQQEVIDIVLNTKHQNSDLCVMSAKIDIEMVINVTKSEPFYCSPRRLSYSQKSQLEKIIKDLLQRGIIRESNSSYASPIVLIQKKNKETRLCIDYRQLNRITAKDNYPLPLIEDHLEGLRGKRYFSVLDLRGGFHHVKISFDSIKYTSFVTPFGQYEYLKMPFGLKNAPSVFQRYVNGIFKELISTGNLFIYMDDLLVATEDIEIHLEVLSQIMHLVYVYDLQLRFDKCKFLYEEITYLGYVVGHDTIRPNPENIKSVANFPIPRNTADVHSFVGLCSYFRKFIFNFAILAKPLYDLLRKDSTFMFGEKEMQIFELLKSKLIEDPILSIYSPQNKTELHCDASSHGFGAILMQCQSDGKFHPVFYYSKRTTDVESRLHSYELETLSIINALRRFRVYLLGIKFKIVTDCQSLTLTLNKKLLNPKISRWALELQDYDYEVEHRIGKRMGHVDALSRCTNIMIIDDNSFENCLYAAQHRDPTIKNIMSMLEEKESPIYSLVNGLVYRKMGDDILFYVPAQMENSVIRTHHEAMCHLGVVKLCEFLRRTYWFPSMTSKVKSFVTGCLKCIEFSPLSGKVEGILHNIPKGNLPFDTIHIDHLGPLPSLMNKKKHILVVIDAFTKFVRLFPVVSTSSKESIACLETYFHTYSRPLRIVSDRGSCFTSNEFSEFCNAYSISHIKIATMTPQSNGQVERVNRVLTPMLSKESVSPSDWSKHLAKIEFALNNTESRSTGFSPSILLFGVHQKGEVFDKIKEYLDCINLVNRDLIALRERASENIQKSQQYNKDYFDKLHKPPKVYKVGDYVMIRNVVTTPGINKKLLAKYRGPYEITKVLLNDRYLIQDIEGMQISRCPYKGICSPINMKPYVI